METFYLGIDAGGTFTDFVLLTQGGEETRLTLHKVLSTPNTPEQAILQGIQEMGLRDAVNSGRLHIIHGSTVATNAALEGRGALTALVTNRGFRDLLTLGRQTRPALYQLEFPPLAPPVEANYCLETGGRLAADGTVLETLDSADLDLLNDKLQELKPDSVAITLLFSFLDACFELAIEEAIKKRHPQIFVSRSSYILPEYREYERGMTTWLNARLSPLVNRYLTRLRDDLKGCSVQIMQSSGETVNAQSASERAVNLLLSGPAAGLAAIKYLSEQLNEPRILSFDMGGTSTDVALLDGDFRITNEGRIANYPVAVPMVDMHTIGAGGGSIAYLDAGGMLRVGPRSAGADPGPACYGRGGEEPTVSDANLVLGRLQEGDALAGSLHLSLEKARQAISRLSAPAGLDPIQTALGIVAIANENMTSALRMISVQRGYDPTDFVLASFGGAGGLHVCALANAIGIRRALVPMHAGVLSALGMLVAPRGRQYSRTVNLNFSGLSNRHVNGELKHLHESVLEELHKDGIQEQNTRYEPSVDVRYTGQSFSLNIPWSDLHGVIQRFHGLHMERYGFTLESELELVNLRLRLTAIEKILHIPRQNPQQNCNSRQNAQVYGYAGDIPVYRRDQLMIDRCTEGPAIIVEATATTFLEVNWEMEVDGFGNLLLRNRGFR